MNKRSLRRKKTREETPQDNQINIKEDGKKNKSSKKSSKEIPNLEKEQNGQNCEGNNIHEEPADQSQQQTKEIETFIKNEKLYLEQIQCLQEKVNNHEQEINELKKKIRELEERNLFLSSVNKEGRKNDLKFSEQRAVNQIIRNCSPRNKGCACIKGNCGTKLCGCVKKGANCDELCRCNQGICKNQEDNKENESTTKEFSNEAQNALKKLEDLNLNREILDSSYTTPPGRKRKLFKDSSGPTDVQSPQEPISTDNEVSTPKYEQLKEENITNRRHEKCNTLKAMHSPIKKQYSMQSDDCRNSYIDQNNSNISPNSNETDDFSDPSFNPMVPRRQLLRSPIQLLDKEKTTLSKQFSPPVKKEMEMEEIDWEKHKAELVTCAKCSRKFWAHRIDIHKERCKGI